MGTSGNGAYRVALLQLPYLYNFLNARSPSVTNVPLAAGYLKANARRVGILEDGVEIEILDPIEADRAGHGRLVERILSLEPDMVGFSVYEWNAHQSFDIARTLKERRPGVVIVVGGPEIIPNSQEVHFNHHRELDVGVMGDGETTFVELVDHYRGRGKSLSEIAGIVYRAADGGIHANPLRTEPESYREIESPYLLGYLDTEAFGFLLMETERGCPFKCAYCNWSGTKRNVFSFDRLKGEIDHARERGIEAVHFLDPTFNTSRNGRELLKYIRKVNEDRSMTFYANVYAELLKEPQIDDLVEANFKHLTAGLQSVNPVALNNINRKNNLPKFVDRVHRLIERGIFVYIDIILGLPGDDLDWVRKTLRFITDNGLEAYSRYNILTVNPDSALWGLRERFGLVAQSQPPYRILQTRELSFEEIKEAIDLCDRTLQFGQCYGFFEEPSLASHFRGRAAHGGAGPAAAVAPRRGPRNGVPPEKGEPEGFVRRDRPAFTKVIIDVDARRHSRDELAALGERLKNDIGSAPVVWFRSADPKSDLPLMQAFFGAITPSNLFGVWKIVLESEELYPARVIDALEAAIEYRVNNIDYDLIYRVDKLEGEWVRHATKTFPVLPIRRKLEAIDLITALGDDPQFLWSLDFRRQGDIEELIGLVPRSLSEGLLIDFAPGFDEELLFECVGEIIRKRGGYSRNLLFRNGLLQHAYDWRLKTTPFKLPERVLSAEGGEIRGVGDFDRERDAVRIGEWVEALLLREQRARADAGFIIAPPGSAAAAAERPQASPMGIDVQGVGYTARR